MLSCEAAHMALVILCQHHQGVGGHGHTAVDWAPHLTASICTLCALSHNVTYHDQMPIL
jgi:hypothetical protein